MGLRERALDFHKEKSSSDDESFNLSLTPRDTTVSGLREKAMRRLEESHPGLQDTSDYISNETPERRIVGSIDDHSRNRQSDEFSSEKLVALQNLLDLISQATKKRNNKDIFSFALLAVMTQTGTRKGALFLFENTETKVYAQKGLELPDKFFISPPHLWKKIFETNASVYYAKNTKEKYPDTQPLLDSIAAEIIVPLLNQGDFEGFLVLDSPVTKNDFHLPDLFYLQKFSHLFSSFREIAEIGKEFDKHATAWRYRDQKQKAYNEFISKLALQKDLEEKLQLLKKTLTENFHLSSFVFLIKNNLLLKPTLVHGISLESGARFEMPINDLWVKSFSKKHAFNEIKDWRDNKALTNKLNASEKAAIETVYSLALYNHGNIAGLFFLFQVKEKLQTDDQYALQGILQTYFWSQLSAQVSQENDLFTRRHINDPFLSLKEYVNTLESQLKTKNSPYSLLFLNIKNLSRISNILGVESAKHAREVLGKCLSTEVGKDGIFNELTVGRFFVIFPNSGKSKIWTLTKKIHKEIANAFPREELRPLISSNMVSRPENEYQEIEAFLFGT